MGADSLAENTPNAPELICLICLLKPKCSGFQWKKASLGVRSPWFNLLPLGILDYASHYLYRDPKLSHIHISIACMLISQ